MKKLLIFSIFIAFLASCTSMKDSNISTKVTATGTVQKLGITTFQYGTHILKTENKIYALKASSINFDDYLEKKVTIKGNKVIGYPLDGGPELVNVTLVKTY